MKILDFETIRSACQDLDPLTVLDWTREAYLNKEECIMPPKPRMSQPDGDYYNVMPCLNEKENLAILKMIGRHALKPGEKRSVMMGDMLVYEADTGVLKALMDAEYITTLRTGAAAAFSALEYEQKDTSVIGLMGLGNIMTVFGWIYFAAREKSPLTVRLLKHNGQEERFARMFENRKNITFEFVDTPEQLIRGAGLVVSAVTSYDGLFGEDDWFQEGVTVVPIMTRGFQNCDLFFDRFYTDETEQIRGFRYFDVFQDRLSMTTDVLHNKAEGRTDEKQRILVYNYGIAVLDLYFAGKLLEMLKDSAEETPYRYCTEKFFMNEL